MALLDHYWAACPWPVRLVTDIGHGGSPTDTFPFPRAHVVGCDLGWTSNLIDALVHARRDDLVLVMQEDFFVNAVPDMGALFDVVDLMSAQPDVGCFRIYPCPGPLDGVQLGVVGRNGRWGEVYPGEPYRISCQAAIWRVEYLRRALASGDGASAFEIRGSAASGVWPGRVLSILREPVAGWPISYICSGISRGKWNPDALDLFKKHGIKVVSARPVDRRT